MTAFRYNCYNCGQVDYLAKDCPTFHPCFCGICIAPPPLDDEGSRLKEEIKQMQWNLATFERSKVKAKAKEKEAVQMLPLDDKSEKEYKDQVLRP